MCTYFVYSTEYFLSEVFYQYYSSHELEYCFIFSVILYIKYSHFVCCVEVSRFYFWRLFWIFLPISVYLFIFYLFYVHPDYHYLMVSLTLSFIVFCYIVMGLTLFLFKLWFIVIHWSQTMLVSFRRLPVVYICTVFGGLFRVALASLFLNVFMDFNCH